jgi:hypothetical protein
MAEQRKPINFTIVPDDTSAPAREYANFAGVAHTPFDFTITFCDVMPFSLSESEMQTETTHVVRAPIKARLVMPVQFIPTLIAALQENLRMYSEAYAPPPPEEPRGPVH